MSASGGEDLEYVLQQSNEEFLFESLTQEKLSVEQRTEISKWLVQEGERGDNYYIDKVAYLLKILNNNLMVGKNRVQTLMNNYSQLSIY